MRKIAANLIFTITGNILQNSYLTIDNKGTIAKITNTNGAFNEIERLEYYSGILVPGFCGLNTLNLNSANTLLYNDIIKNNNSAQILKAWLNGTQATGFISKDNIIDYLINNNYDNNKVIIGLIDNLVDRDNIFGTIKKILFNNNELSFLSLLHFFTITASFILQTNNITGSFDIGKTPGVMLISGYNFKTSTLNPDAQIKRLV